MNGRIRVATPADAGAVRSIYAPFVRDTAVSFETEPPGESELATHIAETTDVHPWLVREADDAVVGYALASSLRSAPAYDWTVECSIYVREGARRSGVGRSLYTSLFAVLALQGFCDAYAVTTLPNPATVGFHETMGFERVGAFPAVGYKGDEWHDVAWWHRQLRERPDEPAPPTPLPEARDATGFDAALHAGEDEFG